VGVAALLHCNPAPVRDRSHSGHGLPAKDQVYTKPVRLALSSSAQLTLLFTSYRVLAANDFTQPGEPGANGFFGPINCRRVVVGAD